MRGPGRVTFLGGGAVSGLTFVRADKDGDGDYDPLTSTSWDGDAKAASTGTINWDTDFGVPTAAKAVLIRGSISDETVNAQFALKAKSTTSQWSAFARTLVANFSEDYTGTVPIAADGTSYWIVTDELDTVYILVVGWFI